MLVLANVFQPLIDVFQEILSFFHDSVGIPWGWSIVVMTVCVRLVMVPLFLKQFQSMRAMQQHMPELNALKEKYKGDKGRQQEEMMKFYKENHVNPFASCLPMVLQLPVFISLYYMLRDNLRRDICPGVQHTFQQAYANAHHIPLHEALGQTTECTHYGPFAHAGFLFIHDITANPAGLTLIALLVLYVGTQLASSLMMAQPTMDDKQRKLMMFMPIVFVPFIIHFPSGLLVYWITTNAWTMCQQAMMRRRIGPPQPAVATEVDGAGGAATATTSAGGTSLMSRVLEWATSQRDAAAARNGGEARHEGSTKLVGSAARRGSNGESHSRGAVGAGGGGGAPPPPPRKKKKRSGRRR